MKTKSMNLALIMGAVLLPALTVSVSAIPIPIEASIPSSESSKASDRAAKNMNATGEKASKASKRSNQLSASASKKGAKNSNARGKNRGASGSTLSPVVPGFGTNPVSGPINETAKLAALSGITPSVAGVTYTTTDTTPIINVPGATTVAQGVPDGGATALLLGISVCGFGWLKRKIAPIL